MTDTLTNYLRTVLLEESLGIRFNRSENGFSHGGMTIITKGWTVFIEDSFYGVKDLYENVIALKQASDSKIQLKDKYDYEFHVDKQGNPHLYVYPHVKNPFYCPLD